MAEFCTERNVFDASLDRIRMIYDRFDEVVVAMSGGKDSTVVYQLVLIVAKEKGKLPLKVFWLDQECEWQATVDYMDKIMHNPDVKPYWFQIPMLFTNSLSNQKNFLNIWDEKDKDKWCHPQSDISIKENPTKYNRFHDVIDNLHQYCFEKETKNGCVLCGIRADENPTRRLLVSGNKNQGWIMKRNEKNKSTKVFPIWDWLNDDVWIAIAKNKWEYNKIYDYQYKWGVQKRKMRVSALIHETAWRSIEMLQEFEPKTYDKFIRRISGTSTVNHMFDQSCDTIPKELPYMFKDWKEYRDYLLVNLVKKEYWELFRNRWKNQNGDEWYKLHCKEVVINDIDGTINHNNKVSQEFKNSKNKSIKKDEELLKEKMKND